MIRLILLAATLAACNPSLTAESFAPPGRAARMDEVTNWAGIVTRYRIELSQGVALAFTCNAGGPCEHETVVSDDPSIAEIRAAALGRLERSGQDSRATSAASIVVGKMPGTTHVHVHAKEGDRDIAVTVIAPPAIPSARVAIGH